jgi:hypothetical protein
MVILIKKENLQNDNIMNFLFHNMILTDRLQYPLLIFSIGYAQIIKGG